MRIYIFNIKDKNTDKFMCSEIFNLTLLQPLHDKILIGTDIILYLRKIL